jgi:NAD+ synthase (glutamine-hydrolysing)
MAAEMNKARGFFNLYHHNFVRVAVGIPLVRVADPAFNSRGTIALMRESAAKKAVLTVFPELGLSAYSCEDLFQQQALLDGSLEALGKIVDASREIPGIAIVCLPLVVAF